MSLGGKSHSRSRPTALGTLANASTWGQTIPTYHGMTRGTLLATWAANLRSGSSAKKSKKKGVKTYVENIDFLIGSNPIEDIFQIWSNNTNAYTLTLVKLRKAASGATIIVGPGSTHDVKFYGVIGVTAEVVLSGGFNDYGAQTFGEGGIATARVHSVIGGGGTGYAANDTFSVNTGTNLATGTVLTVIGGVVQTIRIDDGGTGYTALASYATTTLTGGGSGLSVQVLTIGTGRYSDTYEFPLWNACQHGPDLINAGQARWWPYVYAWNPGYGSNIKLPSWWNILNGGFTNGNGFINIYYAQVNTSTQDEGPLAFNRMTFEQELGNGTEYADAGLSAQQIIYPFYAGAGSSDIDLGASAMIPQWRVEVKGSNCIYGTGDADFSDMIEDTIKSGQLQTLAEFGGLSQQRGMLHRGVNCNELPGPTQKAIWETLEFYAPPVLTYFQPIPANTILIAASRARPSGTTVDISDTAGLTWNSLYAADCVGVFYAQPVADVSAGDVVSILYSGAGMYNDDGYILAFDPGSDTLEGSASANGDNLSTPADISVSFTTAGPAYLLVFVNLNAQPGGVPDPPEHWKDVFPSNPNYPFSAGNQFTWSRLLYRIVSQAGTYTFTLPGIIQTWDLVIVSISQSQPSPWPKALGDIVDNDTMNDLRAQCRANGLYGSVVMDAQRKAQDWLDEFYTCANGAPVWSGFKLKSIPRSEVSYAGNGLVYTSPTAAGPVATLTESDLIGDAQKPLITVGRTAQVDRNNIMQIECVNRANAYNVTTISEPESGGIAMFGPRKTGPKALHEFQDPAIARKILDIEVRRKALLVNTYKFTAMAKWIILEAMDLILINDSKLNIINLPVRITSVKENDNYDLDFEAEPFVYGASAPNALEITSAAPNNADSSYVPALVNPPVIFEPVPRLSENKNERELWLGVSDSDELYGGCVVNLSTDGGASYVVVGTINGNATTGFLTTAWGAGTSPDTTNDLSVDLSESLGVLASYAVADEDNFVYPCYVEGGTADIPYELMTYAVATLTGTNLYTLQATGGGNHLDRAVFGAPNALNVGVSHPYTSRFLFLNPAGTGLLKLVMDLQWIGVTLHFKFQGFNNVGGGLQALADVADYTYTPAGTMGFVNPGGVPPQVFLVN